MNSKINTMDNLKTLIKDINVLEHESFAGWSQEAIEGYLTACSSIKNKAETLLQNSVNKDIIEQLELLPKYNIGALHCGHNAPELDIDKDENGEWVKVVDLEQIIGKMNEARKDKKYTDVRLRASQYAQLKEMAKSRNLPVAAMIKGFVEEEIKNKVEPREPN